MSSFLPLNSPEAFDGVRRGFHAGRCFAYWGDGARALGTVMWGRPLEADVEAMIPYFEIGASAPFKGHVSFVDARGVEAVDLLAFKRLLTYLMARRLAYGPNIARQAVLHPGGVAGVFVSGALHVARPPHPFGTFGPDESRAAFAYCGVAELHDEVEALRQQVSGAPEILRGVRAVLEKNARASTAQLARALGLSQRTLQRRLEAAGSSLRAERQRQLTSAIEELLGGTTLDLDAIAVHVGLTSAAHLVRHFKAVHGVTPGVWRERVAASLSGDVPGP